MTEPKPEPQTERAPGAGPPRRHARVQTLDPGPATDAGRAAAPSPQDAPDPGVAPTAAAPARGAARRPLLGRWARVFLASAIALASLGLALSIDRLIRDLLAASAWIAYPAMALVGLFVLAGLVLILREAAALGRIARVGGLRAEAVAASEGGDLRRAQAVCAGLRRLYEDAPLADAIDGASALGRRDWARLADLARDTPDAAARLELYEREALGPRDAAARAAIRRAARKVATATAIMPSALLDGIAALYLNLALIRRLAEVYGGRAGFVGSLSLARRVIEHAMAVGLIALGDDLLEPLMGGGVASKLSRRLGEGVVNGAMTARIGLAAMELCRPLPFAALAKPKLRELAWEAVSRS